MMNLDIRAPLVYVKTDDFPLNLTENEEFLLCFDIDPVQNRSIEPDPELFLGSLVFIGRKLSDSDALDVQKVPLPAGVYLFIQYRNAVSVPLDRKMWLDLAIEQHKDGLWERYKPKNRLFVRLLFEDGSFVTQLFRPL